jgi:hypothetical protein
MLLAVVQKLEHHRELCDRKRIRSHTVASFFPHLYILQGDAAEISTSKIVCAAFSAMAFTWMKSG